MRIRPDCSVSLGKARRSPWWKSGPANSRSGAITPTWIGAARGLEGPLNFRPWWRLATSGTLRLLGREAAAGSEMTLDVVEQLVHHFHGRGLVAPSLHEQVEDLAFVVNRAPQPELPARDYTAISSRCHRGVGRGRRRRSSRANNSPNFKTHRRTVS
jgi:hypothetical protein